MPRYKTSLRREVPQLQAPKDTTMPTFETSDSQGVATGGGGSSGPPKWLVIGGILVVGLGLIAFTRKKGGGGGSSASSPTATADSVAIGDLAYKVQDGLGALGVQQAAQHAEEASWLNIWGSYLAAGQRNIGSILAGRPEDVVGHPTPTVSPGAAGYSNLTYSPPLPLPGGGSPTPPLPVTTRPPIYLGPPVRGG